MKTLSKSKILLVILALTFALSACTGTEDTAALQTSGVIEANEITIAPEMGGRIVALSAEEGQAVSAGAVLLHLDDSLLLAEKANIEASRDAAEANIRVAQVALDTAKLMYEQTLSVALTDEAAMRIELWDTSKPSEFALPVWYFDKEERIAATQAEADTALEALHEAQDKLDSTTEKAGSENFLEIEATLAEARIAFENAKDIYDDATTGALRDAAQIAYDEAKIDLDDAQEEYDDDLTTDGEKDVLEVRAKVAVAQERYDMSMKNLRAMEMGINAPQVVMAAQAVEQAEAMLEQAKSVISQIEAHLALIDTQAEKLALTSPIDGVILTRSVELGEIIQPGLAAMTVAPLDELTVTVYIPEDRYGEINLGDSATLTVDSFAGESFTAVVTRIADKAEYTPRNVQTKEERQTTVYAVKLTLANVDGKLKPGMPVDVSFGE